MKYLRIWPVLLVTLLLAMLVGCDALFKNDGKESSRKSGRLAKFKGTEPSKQTSKDKDKPDKSREQGKGKKDKDRGRSYHDSSSYYYEEDDDDDDDGWSLDLGLDLEFLFTERMRYIKYPYYHNDPNYFKSLSQPGKPMAGTIQNYYIRVDHKLWAYHISQELRFPTGISLELAHTQYIEDIPDQRRNDRMGWFKWFFNLLWAEDTRWMAKYGIGGTNLSGVGGGLGTQFALGVFPGKPWSLQGSIGYGLLEGGMDITDLEFKLGLFQRRTQYTLGYRWLVNSQGVDLSGIFTGFAWWF